MELTKFIESCKHAKGSELENKLLEACDDLMREINFPGGRKSKMIAYGSVIMNVLAKVNEIGYDPIDCVNEYRVSRG